MSYYKHTELVNTYHVSLKTVHNWINASKKNKVDLALLVHNGKTYIAKTPGNRATLSKLAIEGKKYRNRLHNKVITPKPEFYKAYSSRQILDILFNLTTYAEIPRQYNYFDKGAHNWNAWSQFLEIDKHKNILQGTLELIRTNLGPVDQLLNEYDKVNVIDLGVGNGRAAKELVEHLLKNGGLNRYIGIDISTEMLAIAKTNVDKWFGGAVNFEGYVRDISFERFDDVLVTDRLGNDANKTINLFLLLGGTHLNIRSHEDVIKTIYGSMSNEDLLMYVDKPDSEASRRYFNFNTRAGATLLSANHSFILDMLNIDPSIYNLEMGYDEHKRMRYVRIRLKIAITLRFEFGADTREISIEKGDTILLMRVWHQSSLELISSFDRVGLKLLHSSLTKDRQFMMTISGVSMRQGGNVLEAS
jgi:SAM-dependent methyltransferase